jgi:hypothetical protein
MNHDDILTLVGAIGAVLSLLSIGLRFYARRVYHAGSIRWDDWFILIAGITLIATDVLIIVANAINPNGAEVASNKDPTYVYTEKDIKYTQLSFICTVIYYTIVSATKMSILLMYDRLFSVSRSFRRQIVALCFLTGAFWVGTTLSNCLNCIPIKYVWINADADPRYCINYNLYWLGCGVAESVLDLMIILMPIRVVYGLNLSRGKRVAVAAVFLLGAFVILSGVVKVILSYIPGSRQPDFSRTALWTVVHVCTGIICACLPVCWPVLKRLGGSKRFVSSSLNSSHSRWYDTSGWSVLHRSRRSASQGQNLGEFGGAKMSRDTRSTNSSGPYELQKVNVSTNRTVMEIDEHDSGFGRNAPHQPGYV